MWVHKKCQAFSAPLPNTFQKLISFSSVYCFKINYYKQFSIHYYDAFLSFQTFCAQLPLFLREHFNGMYRTDVYFLSKMVSELPFHIIYPFAFVAIAYYMVGFTDNIFDFLVCAFVVILVANCAVSFGRCLLGCYSSSPFSFFAPHLHVPHTYVSPSYVSFPSYTYTFPSKSFVIQVSVGFHVFSLCYPPYSSFPL